ncbi:MAG: MBL fold metallo-hydrolase [Planctomycetes bacterium]|nr:MBL fold metallo-hydrolase [Planctomycetota bacterium]
MATMRTFSLQSGSNGNSFYVEVDGVRLLFDAGLTGAAAERRMAVHGRDIRDVTALFVSHEHPDHIRSAGVYQRKFGLPIYMTRKTQDATRCKLGKPIEINYFRSGDTVSLNGVRVHTHPTAHDAVDGVAFGEGDLASEVIGADRHAVRFLGDPGVARGAEKLLAQR